MGISDLQVGESEGWYPRQDSNLRPLVGEGGADWGSAEASSEVTTGFADRGASRRTASLREGSSGGSRCPRTESGHGGDRHDAREGLGCAVTSGPPIHRQ